VNADASILPRMIDLERLRERVFPTVGRSTIFKWTRERDLASWHYGRVLLFQESDVLEFIARHKLIARRVASCAESEGYIRELIREEIKSLKHEWMRMEIANSNIQSRENLQVANGERHAA